MDERLTPYGRQRWKYWWPSSLLSCDISIINYKSRCTLPPLRRLEQFSSSLKRIQRVLTHEYLIMSLVLRASQVSFHLSRLLLKTLEIQRIWRVCQRRKTPLLIGSLKEGVSHWRLQNPEANCTLCTLSLLKIMHYITIANQHLVYFQIKSPQGESLDPFLWRNRSALCKSALLQLPLIMLHVSDILLCCY